MGIAYIGTKPMHTRPDAGKEIEVLMKNGKMLAGCYSTFVSIKGASGIVIYHRKKALDETKAIGWRYASALSNSMLTIDLAEKAQ